MNSYGYIVNISFGLYRGRFFVSTDDPKKALEKARAAAKKEATADASTADYSLDSIRVIK